MGTYIVSTSVALGALRTVPAEHYQRVTVEDGFVSASISKENTAIDLATDASTKALQKINLDPNKLGVILYVSILNKGTLCYEPAFHIAKNLQARNVPAFTIHQSCHGGLYALTLAMNLSNNMHKPVLVSISDSFNQSNVIRWKGDNGIFGDGAVSIVLDNNPMGYQIIASSSNCDNAQEAESRGNLEMKQEI